MEALGLHLAQHVVRGLHFDGEFGGAHHLLGAHVELATGGLPAGHEVLEVQDASDVVHVVTDDGHAGEAGAHEQAQGGGGGRVGVDGHHVGARHHNLAHEGVPQVEDGADHVAVLFLEALGFADLVDDLAQVRDQLGTHLGLGGLGGGTRGANAGQERVNQVAEPREAVREPGACQGDTLGVTRAPLSGQEGHKEQLEGGDHEDRDEGDGPPRQGGVDQDDRAHDRVDDLPEGTKGAQRQQGALAVIDEAVEDARVPALFLDEVLDAGQGQALDGLLDALGDRRERQGDDREDQERHGGHIQDRRGRGRLQGKDHRVARKVSRSLRWRANMTSRSASVAWS